jgi:hypothetical protein
MLRNMVCTSSIEHGFHAAQSTLRCRFGNRHSRASADIGSARQGRLQMIFHALHCDDDALCVMPHRFGLELGTCLPYSHETSFWIKPMKISAATYCFLAVAALLCATLALPVPATPAGAAN